MPLGYRECVWRFGHMSSYHHLLIWSNMYENNINIYDFQLFFIFILYVWPVHFLSKWGLGPFPLNPTLLSSIRPDQSKLFIYNGAGFGYIFFNLHLSRGQVYSVDVWDCHWILVVCLSNCIERYFNLRPFVLLPGNPDVDVFAHCNKFANLFPVSSLLQHH